MTPGSRSTPNLPSRDFRTTSAFWSRLGFTEAWRDEHWMILQSGTVSLEFFPHPDLDPSASWFSCCLRLEDADAFYQACLDSGVGEGGTRYPRLHPMQTQPWGARAGALIDPDGTLVRLIQN